MQERELLSDIEGRITHILVGCDNPLDFRELVSIRAGFDRDVRVSIMYNCSLEVIIGQLKEMMATTGKEAHYYALKGDVPLWMQDRLHVFKGKKVMSTLTPEESKRRQKNKTRSNYGKTDIIFESDFWKNNGFEVIPNDLGLYNTDGGELIPAHNKLFVGSRLVSEYAYHDLKKPIKDRSEFPKVQEELREILTRLDPSRELVFVGVKSVSVGEHIDCFFTPLSDTEIFIQLPSGTLELMGGLPSNFRMHEKYFRHYEHNLAQLGEFFIDLGYDIKPMLGLPPFHYLLEDGKKVATTHMNNNGLFISEFLVPYMTYNNIVQESFQNNGTAKRRIYGPSYILEKDVFEELGIVGIYDKLIKLNHAAYHMPEYSYDAVIDNVEIRKIAVGYRAHKIGSLRCSIKVLERE